MIIRVRFNTEYPKGKKWRLVFEGNHEIQVDEFRGCIDFCSESKEMPIVGLKHHLLIHCKAIELYVHDEQKLIARFS
jgi:hypothetical protein